MGQVKQRRLPGVAPLRFLIRTPTSFSGGGRVPSEDNSNKHRYGPLKQNRSRYHKMLCFNGKGVDDFFFALEKKTTGLGFGISNICATRPVAG